MRVLKALPMGLDHAAVDAVKKWRFKPATLNGRPVNVYYVLTVNFTPAMTAQLDRRRRTRSMDFGPLQPLGADDLDRPAAWSSRS